MKLNKVMALALSGLMAVSMLAGCSNGTPNGEENNQGQEVVTDAASTMNKLQDKVEFKADSTLETILAAAMDKVTASEIKNLTANANGPYASGSVYDYLNNKLPSEYKVSNRITYATVAGSDKEVTTTVIYMLKSGTFDEDTALAFVANAMQMGNYKDTYKSTGGKQYNADYTGAVSIQNVTKTAEDGKTYSAYVVAVAVTQTPAEVKI